MCDPAVPLRVSAILLETQDSLKKSLKRWSTEKFYPLQYILQGASSADLKDWLKEELSRLYVEFRTVILTPLQGSNDLFTEVV